MTLDTHAGLTDAAATPVEVGATYIRWGLGLFVFGLVSGFIPLAHYGPPRLVRGGARGVPQERHAVVGMCVRARRSMYAQVGSLGMIALGLCYVVLARDGALTSLASAERMAPAPNSVVEYEFKISR